MIREDAACGILAPAYELDKLFESMQTLAHESPSDRDRRRAACRDAVNRHCDPAAIAAGYIEEYTNLCSSCLHETL